jgi:PAS domain S-box-containing protein
MLAGLLLLETLSIGLFALLLVRQQTNEVRVRARARLLYEATSVALQSSEALLQNRPGYVALAVKMMGEAPTVAIAKVTDPTGDVLFVSKGEADQTRLEPEEIAQIPLVRHDDPRFFILPGNRWEAVAAIYTNQDMRGYAWVQFDKSWSREQLSSILGDTAIFTIIWILASALLVLLMARSIYRPLAILQRGTRALMTSPENGGNFPLQAGVQNEIGDLIEAFNSMVASMAEQRSGLNDTLSLLDSMLANAPIGLAFFDSSCRFTRVNQVFADLTGVSPSRHLGRTPPELLPLPAAQHLETAVQRVFAEQEPMRNFEISGQGGKFGRPWTWLVSAYPVRTTPQQIRWAGVIVLDASDRKRGEEALRKAEKLAVTGLSKPSPTSCSCSATIANCMTPH